jgi:hypothetical protein
MRRLALLLPAAILAALVSLSPVGSVVPGCAAAGSNHAPLVVEHADGSVVTRCVAFDSDSISGEDLLNRSGLAWSAQTFGGFGDAVCAIDGEPVSYVDCLGKDRYWAVFVARAGGSWQLANEGISTLTLGDGDAEGFRYVPASGLPATPVSAAGVCVAAAAAPMATPSTTPSRRPALTAIAATAPPTAGATTAATEPPASVAAPTATATTSAAATTTATPPPPGPIPAPSGGTDLGLMAAAVAGGGLVGLALLRLLASRLRPR